MGTGLALLTPSATIKATVFHEAYTDWLIPWYHYIPLSYDFSELFSITTYFFGLDESGKDAHDDELRAIAERSKEWTDTQLGWEQQKVGNPTNGLGVSSVSDNPCRCTSSVCVSSGRGSVPRTEVRWTTRGRS